MSLRRSNGKTTRRTAWASGTAQRLIMTMHALPSSLVPILAVEAGEILVPGSVKTMQVIGHQDVAMQEVMRSKDKLFALAIISSTACTLCTVLSRKEYMGHGLVKVRGEARIGVSEVNEDNGRDFSLVQIYNMPDASVSGNVDEVRSQLDRLEQTMRDIGNLASKFRSPESAAISQSMRWVNGSERLMPGVLRTNQGYQTDYDERDARDYAGDSNSDREDESDEEIVERAARLSFAALNPVPLSSKEEREAVVRARLVAMETYSLLDRLQLSNRVMASQLSQFSARVSISSLKF